MFPLLHTPSNVFIFQQFLFSKATATKIYHALSEIRRFKKLKKPEPRKRKFFSSLFSFRNAPADSEFMSVFENLNDLQFSPVDEWQMDLCAAANSAASATFEVIFIWLKFPGLRTNWEF